MIGDGIKRIILGIKNAISFDAWGRPKSVFDTSLFNSKFTYNIPDKDWVLPVTVVGTGTAISENGQLVIDSGTNANDIGQLRSRRHPSYQPNRGILYSTALILPEPGKVGFRRRWGIYFIDEATPYETGVLFELEDGVLKGRTVTTYGGVVTNKGKEITIDYTPFWDGVNELDALFDIQGQWRGMGDYYFYINQVLVGTIKNLGVTDSDLKVSIINPSLPCWFESKNTGGTGSAKLIAGCVDVSSEGGGPPNFRTQVIESKSPGTITNVEAPVLIGYIPNEFQGQHNSRDSILRKAVLAAFDTAYVKIYTTRDKSAFGHTVLDDLDGETDFLWANAAQSSVKFYNSGLDSASLFAPAKANLVYGDVSDANDAARPEWRHGEDDITISHGDYIIVTMEKNQAAASINVYAALSMDEEI